MNKPDSPNHLNLNTIARLAGVSRMTVSRVLNQSGYASEETRDKVNRIVAQLGYNHVPNALARIMRGERSGCIATILASFAKPTVTGGILHQIDKLAFLKKYLNYVMSSSSDPFLVMELLDRLAAHRVEGVLFHAWNNSLFCPEIIGKLKLLPRVVLMTESTQEVPFSQVVLDWTPGTRNVVRFFAANGRKRPMLLQEQDNPVVRNAFQEECARHSFAAPPLVLAFPDWRRLEFLEHSFRDGFPVDAVFCSHENYDPVVLFLTKIGLRVPDDVLLIPTLDQVSIQMQKPQMPVLCRKEDMGAMLALELLMKEMEHGSPAGKIISCPPELQIPGQKSPTQITK